MVITMQLIINKGGAMKLPSLRSIERVVNMVPLVNNLVPKNGESESSLLRLIKQQEDTIHNKNADIFKLRQERKAMKRVLFSNNKKIKDLEENLENCAYELNILNNAINNTGG